MLLSKYERGARVPLDESELSRIDATLSSQGGRPRETITRPIGPDGLVTHKLYDFDQSGFALSIDLRECSRGALRFHELDAGAAAVGCRAVKQILFMLLSQLGLAARFERFSATILISDPAAAEQLPAGSEPIVVSTVEEFARVFDAHLPRG